MKRIPLLRGYADEFVDGTAAVSLDVIDFCRLWRSWSTWLEKHRCYWFGSVHRNYQHIQQMRLPRIIQLQWTQVIIAVVVLVNSALLIFCSYSLTCHFLAFARVVRTAILIHLSRYDLVPILRDVTGNDPLVRCCGRLWWCSRLWWRRVAYSLSTLAWQCRLKLIILALFHLLLYMCFIISVVVVLSGCIFYHTTFHECVGIQKRCIRTIVFN